MPSANSRGRENARTGFGEMFELFCLDVFAHQKMAEEKADGIDGKHIHQTISMSLKGWMENERHLAFPQEAREIIYLMAAIADEIFLNMAWDGKKYWEDNMLEERFFGSQVAGEVIFEKINELLMGKQLPSTEKAEIYLKALSLGFRGKFRGLEEELAQINIYRARLYDFIDRHEASITDSRSLLFQKEYARTIPTMHRKLLPDAALVTYISSFFVFMFLVISSMVWMLETSDLKKLLRDISIVALKG
ncbi:MAG: DotU family type IV/VI secretion system protein [Holosporaceae bacterium]|jgi:type VI secretion system protein ImpK|nr:DotU family type IV/VI secretion system protein [Holosporaceae bacterium]